MPDEVPDVKVLDFGLARITDSDVQATTYVTEMGKIRGTLPYMSPEQVRGNPDEIDLRTDVYALGVMLYEMMTGSLPYDLSKAQIPEAVRIICEQAPKSISASFTGTKHLDADVITIAGKCLEKETSRRYQSAAALGEDIQRYLSDQPILARPPSAVYQFRKLAARHKGRCRIRGDSVRAGHGARGHDDDSGVSDLQRAGPSESRSRNREAGVGVSGGVVQGQRSERSARDSDQGTGDSGRRREAD